MELKPKDLKIEVGIRAYELFTNTKVKINLSIDCIPYRSGVFIKHIPTGKQVYVNDEKSQYKNKDIGIEKLKELLKQS